MPTKTERHNSGCDFFFPSYYWSPDKFTFLLLAATKPYQSVIDTVMIVPQVTYSLYNITTGYGLPFHSLLQAEFPKTPSLARSFMSLLLLHFSTSQSAGQLNQLTLTLNCGISINATVRQVFCEAKIMSELSWNFHSQWQEILEWLLWIDLFGKDRCIYCVSC